MWKNGIETLADSKQRMRGQGEAKYTCAITTEDLRYVVLVFIVNHLSPARSLLQCSSVSLYGLRVTSYILQSLGFKLAHPSVRVCTGDPEDSVHPRIHPLIPMRHV